MCFTPLPQMYANVKYIKNKGILLLTLLYFPAMYLCKLKPYTLSRNFYGIDKSLLFWLFMSQWVNITHARMQQGSSSIPHLGFIVINISIKLLVHCYSNISTNDLNHSFSSRCLFYSLERCNEIFLWLDGKRWLWKSKINRRSREDIFTFRTMNISWGSW